jgi:hypothetical protein
VVVQRTAGDAGGFQYRVDRRAVVAVPAKQVDPGFDQSLARRPSSNKSKIFHG